MTTWNMVLLRSGSQLQYSWFGTNAVGESFQPNLPPIAHSGDKLAFTAFTSVSGEQAKLSLTGNSPIGDLSSTPAATLASAPDFLFFPGPDSFYTVDTVAGNETFTFTVILGDLSVDPQMIVEPPIDSSIEPDEHPPDIEALVKQVREAMKRE